MSTFKFKNETLNRGLLLTTCILFSWWLNPLLRKKASTQFELSLLTRFDWFFAKHHLCPVANDVRYALPQRLLNVYVATVQSSEISILFVLIGNDFQIKFRRPGSFFRWKTLEVLLPLRDEQFKALAEEDISANVTWDDVFQFLDRHWQELVQALSPAAEGELN